MNEHQKLLRQIIILGAGLLIAGALIGFDVLFTASGPGTPFYLGLVLLAVLGFLTASWVFTSIEAFTSSAVAEFPPFWLLIYLLAVIVVIALLPIAFIVLLVRYLMARQRFNRESAQNSG